MHTNEREREAVGMHHQTSQPPTFLPSVQTAVTNEQEPKIRYIHINSEPRRTHVVTNKTANNAERPIPYQSRHGC